MATILVDYENVCGSFGLSGAEFLTESDDLCVFYSNMCTSIRKEDSNKIEESGCGFRLCKLKVPRKNALDFYIATEAGVAYQKGEEFIIVITRDTGLQSIRDYFDVNKLSTRLIIAPTIQQGLLAIAQEDKKDRAKLLVDNNEKVDLSEACARIDERNRIREALMECLSGTEYTNDIARIMSCVEKAGTSSKRNLYRTSLHEFGIASGTVIYNMLKQVV